MTNPGSYERHPHHAYTWPSDVPFQLDGIDLSSWHTDAMGPESTDPSHSQSGNTSGSQGQDTSQSDTEGGERDQTHVSELPPTSGEAASSPAHEPSSSTPNARASRLFRERRKERERILRETIAELAERNAALEALLLRHGIVPPPVATLRHDLSLHRSQRLGGPPIHIPGVTVMRPSMIPSLSEPSNLRSQPASCGPQPFGDPSFAPSQPSSTLLGAGRSSSLEEQHGIGRLGMPPTVLDNLPAVRNLAQSSREAMPTGSINPSYPIASQLPHQSEPIAMANRTTSHLATAPLPAQQDLYGSSKPGPSDAVFTHTRAPSDSALLAKLPALTPAEHRIIAARGGHLPDHVLPMAMLPEGVPTGSNTYQQQSQRLQEQHGAPQTWIPHPSADPDHRDMRLFAPNAAMSGVPTIEAASPSRGQTAASERPRHLGSVASDFVRRTTAGRGGPYPLLPPTISATDWPHPAAQSEPQWASPTTRTFPHPDRSQMPPAFPYASTLAAQSRSSVSSQNQTQSDDPTRTFTVNCVLEEGEGEAEGKDDEQTQASETENPSSPLLYESDHLTEEGKAATQSLERSRRTTTKPRRPELPKPSSF
ncbi:uncharacterized protein UTRI_05805_B [Ustilago trichophora]|uniref:BZIP domain-containing protein n=1 Tax=Ustilago trichophora TaxID=86804 RepID=A0A5C3ERQ2_9BASI|nr:uncharacterized protein UTRI_05805_B [Ustilago trichophora]